MRQLLLMLITWAMVLTVLTVDAATLPAGKDALIKWADSCQDYTGKAWCTVEAAKTLLKNGADPNAADQSGTPALHRVIDNGLDVEIVRALIDGGARVNQKDKLGAAPLHHLRYWNPQVLEALLKAGADTNAQDGAGYTALMYAVLDGPELSYVKALLGAGADVSLKSKANETALSIAEKRLEEHRRSAAKPGQPSGIVEANKAITAQYEEVVRLLKAAVEAKGRGVSAMTVATSGGGGATASGSGSVLRPSCNVSVKTYTAPKRISVPAGTVFYVCPDEESAVDRKIAIAATPKLTGEIDGWLEYEFRPGVPVYARNTKAASIVSAGTSGTNAQSKPSTSGIASAGGTNEPAANVVLEKHTAGSKDSLLPLPNLPAVDVGGVKLGSTQEEATRTLRGINGAFVIVPFSNDGKHLVRGIIASTRTQDDKFVVYLDPQGSVWAVFRDRRETSGQRIQVSDLLETARKKYGKESDTGPLSLRWRYVGNGQQIYSPPDSKCMPFLGDPLFQPKTPGLPEFLSFALITVVPTTCTRYIRVSASGDVRDGLAGGYSVSVVDSTGGLNYDAYERNRRIEEHKRKVENDKANSKKVDL